MRGGEAIVGATVTRLADDGFRLPTEAGWEHACRAGTATEYSSGDTEEKLKEVGWYSGNAGGTTHPVGGLKPNGFGLFDMHGNVWEWCGDGYDPEFCGKPEATKDDPECDDSEQKTNIVVRGGSWLGDAGDCRAAYRNCDARADRADFVGFRVCAVLD